MDAPEFVDKVLTPLGAGLGGFIAFRFVPQLRDQPKSTAFIAAAAVVVIYGAIKWLA